MTFTFRMEESVIQLTHRSMRRAVSSDIPLWILFSKGSQCISGSISGEITKYIDLSHLLKVNGMDGVDDYIAQPPWIVGIISGIDVEVD